MSTATRASLDELLQFANKVREAGGGAVLDALMPARPADSKRCLIARNLNFECSVSGGWGSEGETWGMTVNTPELAAQIATSMNLELEDDDNTVILLPDEIGEVAHDFDLSWDEVDSVRGDWLDYKWYEKHPEYQKDYPGGFPPNFAAYLEVENPHRDLSQVREFWPYIEASLRESGEYGFLNDKGELIL